MIFRNPSNRFRIPLPWGAMLLGMGGCGFAEMPSTEAEKAVDEVASTLTEAVSIVTRTDDSATPIHIQIKECTTTAAADAHVAVDCVVDPEYALVGGGAAGIGSSYGGSPFLTESRPLDERTWRASSTKHLVSATHNLAVYAIGMRLDGVNTQALRDAIKWKQVQLTGDTAAAQVPAGSKLIGGGAQTIPDASANGVARFLKGSYPPGFHEWRANSKNHYFPAAGTTSVWLLTMKDQVIEGFGGLEIKILTANADRTNAGFSTSSVQVEPGWALIGMGGLIQDDANQTGRMFVSIQPGQDSRGVSVTSRSQIDASSGTTTAYAIEARKRPSTHGLCNPGSVIDRNADSCVNAVCSRRSSCCTTSWDSTCVGLVQPVCGRSCAQDTCVPTAYEPQKWKYADDSPVASNCYFYSQNKYPTPGVRQDPGYSLNLRPTDNQNIYCFPALAAGDGLIPSSLTATCPDNRTKIYMYANPGGAGSYHVYRQDGNGLWSDKFATWGQALLTPDDGVSHPQHNAPQGNPVEVYMCACDHPLPSQLPPKTL
jgi:hypothetical protein